jgi:hypothetical protein
MVTQEYPESDSTQEHFSPFPVVIRQSRLTFQWYDPNGVDIACVNGKCYRQPMYIANNQDW